jgi:hypothetical protein
MQIPDEVRKAVGFIAYRHHKTGDLVPVGSVFFVGPDHPTRPREVAKTFAVTARHVIDGLRSKGLTSSFLRLNSKVEGEPFVSIEIPLDHWSFDQTDDAIDVAAIEFRLPSSADHLSIPLSIACTPEKIAEHEVSLGDDIFISGLFVHHYGSSKNIPIVRIGAIASLMEEKVTTRRGAMDAYLVECRSTGGLSGSPVFVNLGMGRVIKGVAQIGSGGGLLLLGLVHGHFDVVPTVDAAIDEDALSAEGRINSGIAIVAPVQHIMRVIDGIRPKFSLLTDRISHGGPISLSRPRSVK